MWWYFLYCKAGNPAFAFHKFLLYLTRTDLPVKLRNPLSQVEAYG
jgi:hypothetical protein